MASGYVAGGGAIQAASGSFPTGVDITGLGVSSAEYGKKIPTGLQPVYDFAAQRGGLAGPGNGPATGIAQVPSQQSVTFGQALQGLTAMDPAAIEALQQSMYQAKLYSRGYYKKGADDPVTGLLDSPTISAYIKTLRLAYNNQTPVTDILAKQKANHPELAGILSPDDLAPSFKVSNPTDLAAVAVEQAQKKLGRRATAAEISSIITRYQAQEKAAQAGSFSAQPGDVVTQPADPGNFAANYFQQHNPQEAANNSMLGLASKAMEIFQQFGTTTPMGSI